MIGKSRLKDYIGILFYRHGLFCASNPFSVLMFVFAVLFLCCYPIANLSLFGSSLEQYKQPISAFDGLEANAEINEYLQYERMADRPAWYNRVPIAYIQRIVIKSVFPVPLSVYSNLANESKSGQKANATPTHTESAVPLEDQLYLIDLFRASLGKLFELNELIRNFHTDQPSQKSLVSDLCVHVGELSNDRGPGDAAKEATGGGDEATRFLKSKKSSTHNDPIRYFLPEFNCLYLSPANFWSNDFSAFMQDDNIMQTINDVPSFFPDDDSPTTSSSSEQSSTESKSKSGASSLLSLFDKTKRSSMKKSLKQLRELLFGVAWPSTLSLLKKDPKLFAKLMNRNLTNTNVNHSKSVVFKYAITIALKKYDKEFIDQLKAKLVKKFAHENYANYQAEAESHGGAGLPSTAASYFEHELEHEAASAGYQDTSADENVIVNLQYTRRSFVYYIPYIILYLLLFLYIYISVRKIEFVKSKWGLAFAAVAQVIASLFMSIGICSFFGLTPTLNGGEIFPYLVIFIGFENIVVLTKSVVSTPYDLDVRYRIALGLKRESWLITKNLTFELIIIFFGILTMVPAIQEFCVFAYVGLLIDFFMQMIFFVTVLSIDIRRMELSDLNKQFAGGSEGATRNSVLANDANVQNKIEKLMLYKLSKKNSSKNFNSLIEEEKLRGRHASSQIFTQNENAASSRTQSSSTDFNAAAHESSSVTYRGGQQMLGSSLSRDPSAADFKVAPKKAPKSPNKPTSGFFIKSYGTLVVNKSVQFFYFWARTRLVQRAVMLLTLLWIILICYKSLLVVELMRHDVNVSKETVEALIPKGINLPQIVKENIQQFVFTSTNNNGLSGVASTASSSTAAPASSTALPTEPPLSNIGPFGAAHHDFVPVATVDYLRRHIGNFMRNVAGSESENEHVKASIELASLLYDDSARTTTHKINPNSRIEQDWQSLNYYHWLRLFANYNVSLYNRYVAILPQISLHKIIGKADVLQYRNQAEIKNYRAFPSLLDDFNNLSLNKCTDRCEDGVDGLAGETKNIIDSVNSSKFSSALFELFIIVILGIPTIFFVVYLFTMMYKCLCSKKYEEWRRTWSTSNIKRQYKIMHSKASRSRRPSLYKFGHESDPDSYELDQLDDQASERSSRSTSCASESDSNPDDEVLDEEQDGGSSEFSVKRLSKREREASETDKDVILNKIINGKKDEIELMPYNLFNVKTYDDEDDEAEDEAERRRAVESEEDVVFTKHKYPLDLIGCGSFKFATSDINNQIIVWPLTSSFGSATTGAYYDDSSSLARTIDLNQTNRPPLEASTGPPAVWSLCLSNDDRCLFVGQSDGVMKVFSMLGPSQTPAQTSYKIYSHPQVSSANSGITHVIEISQSAGEDQQQQRTVLNRSTSSEQSILLKNIGPEISSSIIIKSPTESKFPPFNPPPAFQPVPSYQQPTPPPQQQQQPRQVKTYLILVVRINGFMELVRYTHIDIDLQHESKALRSTESMTLAALASTSVASLSPPRPANSYMLPPSSSSTPNSFVNPSYFSLMHSLRVHYSPITNLNHPPGSNIVLLSTQDNQLKLIKINNISLYGPIAASAAATPVISMPPSVLSARVGENEPPGAAAYLNQPQLQIRFASNEHGGARVTAIAVDVESHLHAATGSDDGLICIWNLFTSECRYKIKRNPKKANKRRSLLRMNRAASSSTGGGSSGGGANSDMAAIVKLELAKSLLISLSADHQLCIWNISSGQLVKEFKFVAPHLNESQLVDASSKAGSSQRSLLGAMFGFLFAKSARYDEASKSGDSGRFSDDMMPQQTMLPTMCLYSSSILITGGCSCVFVWNLAKGELIKKIYINKSLNKYMRRSTMGADSPASARLASQATAPPRPSHGRKANLANLSQMHVIKEIRLVSQSRSAAPTKSVLFPPAPTNNNKLLLVTDYTDTIYLIKLPEKLLRSVN